MSKDHKLINRIRNNPKSVTFEDLDNILRYYGFQCRQLKSGSSHYVYTFGPQSITVPHKRPNVEGFYVKAALACIEQVLEDEARN